MVGDLLIVHVTGLPDPLPGRPRKDLRRKGGKLPVGFQSPEISPDLLCHRRGKHSGVRPGIGHQLSLIQLLHHPQGLVGADLKAAGAFVLELRQIEEKGRIFLFLLPLDGEQLRFHRLFLLQEPDQALRVLLFLKTVFLIQPVGLAKRRTGDCPPLALEFPSMQAEISQHPVKGRLDEIPDLPLPADHHPQHAGHDPAHGNHRIGGVQVAGNRISVFQGQKPGKINPHQVIFLGPQIGGAGQVVILRQVLRLPDAPQDFLLRLGIDPDAPALFPVYSGHLLHQTVNVFSLPPGVGADVYRLHVRPVQQPLYDVKLLFHRRNHLIQKPLRQKRQGLKAPFFVFLIVDLRIAHGHQMAHAPGHDAVLPLQIAVPPGGLKLQRLGKFLGHAGLLGNI